MRVNTYYGKRHGVEVLAAQSRVSYMPRVTQMPEILCNVYRYTIINGLQYHIAIFRMISGYNNAIQYGAIVV